MCHYEDQSLMPSTSNQYASLGLQLLIMTLQLPKLRYENQKTLQFRQLNVYWTQHAKKKQQYGTDSDIILQPIWSTTKLCVQN